MQVQLVPIADRHVEYARQVQAALKAQGIRAELDDSSARMNAKIRQAQLLKIPYMFVMGDKEQQAGAVNIRLRNNEQLGAKPLAEAMALIQEAIKTRANI